MDEQVHVKTLSELPGITAVGVDGSSRGWREIHSAYSLCAVIPPPHGPSEGRIRYRRWDLDVSPGQVLLMEPGEVHVTKRVRGTANFRMFQFQPEVFQRLLGLEPHAPRPHFRLPAIESAELVSKLCRVHTRMNEGASAEEASQDLASLLCDVRSAGAVIGATQDSSRRLRREVSRAAKQLQQRYLDGASLDTLAEEVGLTRFRLVQVFSKEFGLPPMQYLKEWRLHLGRQQLARGSSVAEAAAYAGFYDQAQFCKIFKCATGLTPSEYQRAVRGK